MPRPAAAWSEFGHLTVCDLAYRNLTDRAQQELKALFHAPDGISVQGADGDELRHYTSFNVGCLEEDAFPRKHPDDHFINVARDVTEITDNTCPTQASCILAGIGRDLEILKDETNSDEKRVFALMALGHWVGDIHQPLHVSFADDRGGNSIKVALTGRCGRATYSVKNLHGMWDACLLEAGMFERVRQRDDFNPNWSKRTITYRAVDTLQANTTWTEEMALVGLDPWIWANESYQITLRPDVLYCVMVEYTCQYDATHATLTSEDEDDWRVQQVSQAYLAALERTAQDRVRKAGIRLAHLINLALDPGYTMPIQNSTQRP